MTWSYALLAICVACWVKNQRAAISFTIPLVIAMAITVFEPPFAFVWFFATYACVGAFIFFLLDWKIGALLCVVSLASMAHAVGFIDAVHRNIAGEALFVVCLIAATFSKPANGIATWYFADDAGSGHRSNTLSASRGDGPY